MELTFTSDRVSLSGSSQGPEPIVVPCRRGHPSQPRGQPARMRYFIASTAAAERHAARGTVVLLLDGKRMTGSGMSRRSGVDRRMT